MSWQKRGIVVCLWVVCPFWAASLEMAAAQDSARLNGLPATSAWREKVDEVLSQVHELDYQMVPLTDVVSHLQDRTGIPVRLDGKSLGDAGIDDDVLISLSTRGLPLRSSLRRMLGDLELTYLAQDGGLLITTQERAETALRTVVLDVHDFVTTEGKKSISGKDYEPLIDLIRGTIAPDSWDSSGGPATLYPFDGGLVVSSDQTHIEAVQQLLQALRVGRRVASENGPKPPAKVRIDATADVTRRVEIEALLDAPVDLAFQQAPLQAVVEDLANRTGLTILVSVKALADAGIDPETPVTVQLSGLPLRLSLNQFLEPLELTWLIRDRAVVVTTEERHFDELQIAAYPVADLVGDAAPVDLFGRRGRSPDMERIVGMIQSSLSPSTWSDTQGGPGAIKYLPGIQVLVVSQMREVHEQIGDLLAQLRQQKGLRRVADAAPQANADPLQLVVYRLPRKPSSSNNQISRLETGPDSTASSATHRSPFHELFQFGGGPSLFDHPEIPEERLAELITTMIEPESWEKNPDVRCTAAPGVLIIRHTMGVHRNVRTLLDELGVSVSATSLDSEFSTSGLNLPAGF